MASVDLTLGVYPQEMLSTFQSFLGSRDGSIKFPRLPDSSVSKQMFDWMRKNHSFEGVRSFVPSAAVTLRHGSFPPIIGVAGHLV